MLLAAFAALSSPLCFRADADAVTDWNAIMQTTVASGNANIQARSGAIVQLSVFEAVNAVIGDCEPYLGTIAAPAEASPDAMGDMAMPADAKMAKSTGTVTAIDAASGEITDSGSNPPRSRG